MEIAVNQRLPEVDTDVEEAVENGLQERKSRHQYSTVIVHGGTKGDNGHGEPSDNKAYLDENGGAVEDLDIRNILYADPYDAKKNGIVETAIASNQEAGGKSEVTEEEIEEEEEVELEFEKAIPKIHTHKMHCPNCDAHITKVVLRRKIIKKKKPRIPVEPEKPIDLLGCLSCFSLFTSTGYGSFKPFPVFKPVPQHDGDEGEVASHEDGNCFSIFRVFRKEPKVPTIEDHAQAKPDYVDPASTSPTPDNKYVTSKHPRGEETSTLDHSPATGHVPSQSDVVLEGNIIIDMPPPTQELVEQDSTSFEILKSVVYGGLMEVIASLSVVASAAAADATTLTIIALALANLIGGILVIGHNLWDLRDDCYKFSSQQTNQETPIKYKELLGQVKHFPLHLFFAILSFLLFGIIPPVAYGYSFHETNDKDFTIVVVAVASLVCVGLLAIFKAYIDKCFGFLGYVKTIAYYLTTAVSVSGVSYVTGNLVTRLVEELGLFETDSGVATSFLPKTNPSLAYY